MRKDSADSHTFLCAAKTMNAHVLHPRRLEPIGLHFRLTSRETGEDAYDAQQAQMRVVARMLQVITL